MLQSGNFHVELLLKLSQLPLEDCFMSRITGGVLALVLVTPALWGEDKAKDKPATPAEQYQALLQEYQEATKAFVEAFRNAKTGAEQMKVRESQDPKKVLAPKFLALAEKYPDDPLAIDALLWVVTGNVPSDDSKGSIARARDILLHKHIDSPKLGPLCQSLVSGYGQYNEVQLKAILAKNPHDNVKAEACLALGQNLNMRALLIHQMRGSPELRKQMESSLSKETVEELRKTDLGKLEAAYQEAYREFVTKYAPGMKADRLIEICQMSMLEPLLAAVAENDGRRDVQGWAWLRLAQTKRQFADSMRETEPTAAKRLLTECESIFEKAGEKYADVKIPFGGTVGERAKSELFDLRHLCVGKTAPDIVGQDQDGKKFRLTEYRGKVVLLDFWSEG
jgi:hypothetical protein